MNLGWNSVGPTQVPCFLSLTITAVQWGSHSLSFPFPESLRDAGEKMIKVTQLCKLLSQYCICEELFSAPCFHPTQSQTPRSFVGTHLPLR